MTKFFSKYIDHLKRHNEVFLERETDELKRLDAALNKEGVMSANSTANCLSALAVIYGECALYDMISKPDSAYLNKSLHAHLLSIAMTSKFFLEYSDIQKDFDSTMRAYNLLASMVCAHTGSKKNVASFLTRCAEQAYRKKLHQYKDEYEFSNGVVASILNVESLRTRSNATFERIMNGTAETQEVLSVVDAHSKNMQMQTAHGDEFISPPFTLLCPEVMWYLAAGGDPAVVPLVQEQTGILFDYSYTKVGPIRYVDPLFVGIEERFEIEYY